MASSRVIEPLLREDERRVAMEAAAHLDRPRDEVWQARRFAFVSSLSSAVVAAIVGVMVFYLGMQHGSRSALLQSEEPHMLVSPHRRILRSSTVLLISSDAFRWDYVKKVHTPNINRLRLEGTSADGGIIPVFPSVTFPNHYAIATGLYPASHGIVGQYFSDPITGERFHPGKVERKWWIGQPIWQTAQLQGVKAAAYFWPGSEVNRTAWTCPSKLCPHFNKSVPLEERVDAILNFLDLPESERPRFLNLYLSEPDETAHWNGPDSPQAQAAVALVDTVIGRLLTGLEQRGILDDIHLIMLGDHGMSTVCVDKKVYLEDLSETLAANADKWVENLSPYISIRPGAGVDPKALLAEMKRNQATAENGQFLSLFLKEELPERFHYTGSDRIPAIIGYMQEGYGIKVRHGDDSWSPPGQHGYDNQMQAMHPIFFARGPRFPKGRTVPSFKNIEVYNIICNILRIQPSPNNGTRDFHKTIMMRPCEEDERRVR